MDTNLKEKTTRMDLYDDDLERLMDNDTGWIDTRREIPTQPPRAAGTTPSEASTESANPFKPRASLSRSPAGRTKDLGSIQEKGEEDEIFEIEDSPNLGGGEKRKPVELNDEANQDEGVLVAHEILEKMAANTREATKAVKAIYQYAATTKNVSRILKGKSGVALNYLESLSKELGEALQYGKARTGPVFTGNNSKSTTVNAATQTETFGGGSDKTLTTEGLGGGRRILREVIATETSEYIPTTSVTTTPSGGGDKRKEISPPELARAKRSRPNARGAGNAIQSARGTGNAIQSARWVNESMRGRTQGLEDRAVTDPRNTRTRFSLDNQGDMECDTGVLPAPPRRRPRPAPDDKWDYVTGVPRWKRKLKRPLYAEVVDDNCEGPYGKAYRPNPETAYLRKARIPHWEWCGYSSWESSDGGNEETPNRGTERVGRPPYMAARANDRPTSGTTKQQEPPNGGPAKKGKRPRKRVKPEAVLVRVEPGRTYLETYKAISGELKTLIKGVKGVRKTRTGQMLIEVGPEGKVEEVSNSVRKSLGEGAQVRILQETTTFQLRGLDPIITKDEVATDLAEAGKIDTAEVIVQTLRPMRDGTQAAIVRIPTRKVSGELRSGRLRIGLVICRARILPEITRCFRCHQNGHVGSECKNLEAGKSLCRKCGQEGHNMEACERSPRCVLCANTGFEGANVRHVAGALNCPAFRGSISKHNNG